MDARYEPVVAENEKHGVTANVTSILRPSVRPSNHRSPTNDKTTTRKSRPKSWIWHMLSHVVSVLWMAPIISLLVLNFTNHVIGASIWCPNGHCNSDEFGDDAVTRAAQLDRKDHDVNGALQFVAKALEVWFMFIATALVYDLTMMFARKSEGLPMGYLLTHLEFGDVRNLFNPTLWTSPIPKDKESQRQRGAAKLYVFAGFATFLTVLVNLMGPGVAILVLPSLQWVDQGHNATQRFTGLALDQPPVGNILNCTAETLAAGNYSCASNIYGSSLDAWVAGGVASTRQETQPQGQVLLSVAQESSVSLALNGSATQGNDIIWVPNRQVLRFLSEDYLDTIQTKYNNSLQLVLKRQGPSVGLDTICSAGNINITTVADDKDIHCWSNFPATNDTGDTNVYNFVSTQIALKLVVTYSSSAPVPAHWFRMGNGKLGRSLLAGRVLLRF